MISDIVKHIFKKERLLELDAFVQDYSTFEEIPLVTRDEHLRFLEDRVDVGDYQLFLINLAFFLLINIDLYARHKLSADAYGKFFVCMSFPGVDELDTYGYVVPNFFVTRKNSIAHFLKTAQRDELADTEALRSAFNRSGLIGAFRFVKTVTRDEAAGDVIRLYAIDRVNLNKLESL